MALPSDAPIYDVDGVKEVKALHEKTYSISPTDAVAAPGRVNLIGEHTDYTKGFVMPLALLKSTYAVGSKLPDSTDTCKVVSSKMSGVVEFKIRPGLTAADRLTDEDKTWANFVMGMAGLYMDEGHKIAPFAASICSDVPFGAGLSSSAALEVSVGKLLEEMNGLTVSDEDRARIARKCEHIFGGVECGIMDQLISSCGKMGHALFIECSEPPKIVEVPIASPDAVIVVANTMEKHKLTDSMYGKRVAECEEARAAMGVASLREATMENLENVRETLNPVTFKRAKHVISENERTEKAKEAFRKGDLVAFGLLMNKSHASLKNDYEVTSKGLNALVEIASGVEGVYGTRMTGAGFGGCTVTLVRKDAVDKLLKAFEEQYPKMMEGETDLKSYIPDCFPTTAGAGARSLTALL